MTIETAFVGDIHGNLAALLGLMSLLDGVGKPHTVFLGDYINKGAQSAEVMQSLIDYKRSGRATLLKGNHEATLLNALETSDLAAFLKIGGAMTIRSYVGGDVGPAALSDFEQAFPDEHLEVIRGMPETYESARVFACHHPNYEPTSKFRVSAHVPSGDVPVVDDNSVRLDTGCGKPTGRLTAFLWPSRQFMQVDASGIPVGQ